ncbi:MAG: transglutaminase domain-containing protein [Nitrospina sp.]|nr:transglutaminase domain-containing protein [Nitrospina sp.]
MKLIVQIILILWMFCGSVTAQPLFQDSPLLQDSGEREDWMGTYFQGRKIGFTRVQTRWTPKSVKLDSTVFFQIRSQSIDQSTTIHQKTELDPDFKLRSFSILQEITGHRQQVEGKMEANRLTYRMKSRGFDREKSIEFSPETLPSSTFLLNLMAKGLQVGQKGIVPLFLEPFQMLVDLEFEVLDKENLDYEGQPVETFAIKQKFSGIESTLWVAKDGSVIKETTNQGFESFKESAQVAQKLDESLTVSSLITMSLVKPDRPIDQSDRVRNIIFHLQPLRSPDLVPQDHRQRLLKTEKLPNGLYRITLEVKTEAEQNISSAFGTPGPDPKYLQDSAEVQARHPMIQALARELAGEQHNVWQVAKDINRWVYLNLEKELVDTVTALDALHERRGECQSHTFLFTALARAAGIPTRIVNGLVYSAEYAGFLYHAWPEVYVGEWRALDPTFGQDRVDATHIKLTEGTEDGPFRLMEFVGKVEIDWFTTRRGVN